MWEKGERLDKWRKREECKVRHVGGGGGESEGLDMCVWGGGGGG